MSRGSRCHMPYDYTRGLKYMRRPAGKAPAARFVAWKIIFLGEVGVQGRWTAVSQSGDR